MLRQSCAARHGLAGPLWYPGLGPCCPADVRLRAQPDDHLVRGRDVLCYDCRPGASGCKLSEFFFLLQKRVGKVVARGGGKGWVPMAHTTMMQGRDYCSMMGLGTRGTGVDRVVRHQSAASETMETHKKQRLTRPCWHKLQVNPQLKGHLKGALNGGAGVEQVRAVRQLAMLVCEAAGMRVLSSSGDGRGGWGWRSPVQDL